MNDGDRARALLASGPLTIAVCRADLSLTSDRRGLVALLEWLDEGRDLSGAAAADTVVGKAAALLYVLAGVASVHGNVMSESAEQVLAGHEIAFTADLVVPRMLNRDRSDLCPMERAVTEVDEPGQAPEVIRATRAALMAAAARKSPA